MSIMVISFQNLW